MKTGPDISTIYRIARYYYADGLSQAEIAGLEGFSRSQISRLIDRARELGLVKITLVPPADLRTEELAAALMERLGLRSAIVVPLRKDAAPEETSLAIATIAAERIPAMIGDFEVVGLGWGHTVYKTAELLPGGSGKGGKPFFVPLVGISGDDSPDLQINTIIDRFASSFRTKGMFVNISSVREKDAPLSRIEKERIAALGERWKRLDAAVIGLGSPPSATAKLVEEFPSDYKAALRKSPACGDILAQFFGPDGKVYEPDHNYELLAYGVEGLAGLRRSICLAGGPDKHAGIVAAARARYISDLVTDENTALAALALLDQKTEVK